MPPPTNSLTMFCHPCAVLWRCTSESGCAVQRVWCTFDSLCCRMIVSSDSSPCCDPPCPEKYPPHQVIANHFTSPPPPGLPPLLFIHGDAPPCCGHATHADLPTACGVWAGSLRLNNTTTHNAMMHDFMVCHRPCLPEVAWEPAAVWAGLCLIFFLARVPGCVCMNNEEAEWPVALPTPVQKQAQGVCLGSGYRAGGLPSLE